MFCEVNVYIMVILSVQFFYSGHTVYVMQASHAWMLCCCCFVLSVLSSNVCKNVKSAYELSGPSDRSLKGLGHAILDNFV